MMNNILNRLSLSSSSNTNQSPDECMICLQVLNARGGNAIMSPGCCGKFYHQNCLNQLIQSGNNASCPNCRQAFAVPALPVIQQQQAVQVQSPILMQQQQMQAPSMMQQQTSFRNNVFGGFANNIGPSSFSRHSRSQSVSREVTGEELLDKESSITKPINETTLSNKDNNNPATITVKCQPERNDLSLAEMKSFFVNVSLKASVQDVNSLSRMAMDIVCVLDNSGSMSGSKLTSVKEAMRFVRSQLTATDRLSVINFNSNAETIHGLIKMTEVNKTRSGAFLNELQAEGGTDIYDGMKSGFDVLFSRQTSNKISCLFLLTDGQDSSHESEKIELGKRMRAMGYSLFVFGFGNDHDDKQLKLIANSAEGTFTFVEEDSMVVDAFGGSLGGQQSMVAKDLCLTISMANNNTSNNSTNAPSNSSISSFFTSGSSNNTSGNGSGNSSIIKLEQAFSGEYPQRISPDRNQVEVTFANMFMGETRDVLIKVSIPSCISQQEKYPLLSAQAVYKNVEGVAKTAIADVNDVINYDATHPETAFCFIQRKNESEIQLSENVNADVDVQKNRILFVDTMEQVKSLAESGHFDEAKKIISDCEEKIEKSVSNNQGNMVAKSLLEDLIESKRKVNNKREYAQNGGSAQISEYTDTYARQRSAYTKGSKSMANPYQNLSSISGQANAKTSKIFK